MSRRGLPKDIVCDNGINFVGESNELNELEALDHKKIQDTTTSHGVKWHFNPSLGPHFSGVHEIMIRLRKSHLCHPWLCRHLRRGTFECSRLVPKGSSFCDRGCLNF